MIGRCWQLLQRAHRPTLLIGYAALAVTSLGLWLYLREAETPWRRGVEACIEAGRTVKVENHIVSGLWYGSWINLVLCGLLALALPFLAQPLSGFRRTRAGIAPRSRGAFVIASLIALSLAVSLCLPRLSKSLWGDEEYTLRRSVIGEYERVGDSPPELRPLTWQETWWSYKKPNNHVLNSVLTRLSHEMFFRQTDAPDQLHFDETILRLPAFLAALGAIVACAYALACLGFLRAGILAMFLLALHPWFLRYGTETRGYAFALLFAALSLAFLIKAVRRGRWQYWIAYALCEFLMFLAYPGTFYALIAMNLSALALTLSARGGWPNRRILTGRLLLANIVAGMLVIQTMAPCYAQLKAYLAKSEGSPPFSWPWLSDNISYLVSGMPWRPWQAENPLCHSLSQHPVLGVTLLTLSLAAVLAGVVRLYSASLQTRYLLPFFVLPWPLLVGISTLQGTMLYQWYSLLALVPTTMMIALGVEWLSRAKFLPSATGISPLPPLLFLGLFSVVTHQERVELRKNSVEPLRESVMETRTIVNPTHPDIEEVMTVGFVQPARAYDAAMYFIRRSDPPGRFESLLEKADAEGKPLFVNLALPNVARIEFPEIMQILDDPSQFERSAQFYGLANNTTRLVYRYIGGARTN
ncbi:MAG: hypothetical protein ACR2RV_00940 [Verrucomicrobiales bacterium]